MTECISTKLSFSGLKRQEIVANFAGGRLTSDGGALLLREVDHRLGLTKALAECITDPRNLRMVIHDVQTMLIQRIFGIALGYEDLNDHQILRDDPHVFRAGRASLATFGPRRSSMTNVG